MNDNQSTSEDVRQLIQSKQQSRILVDTRGQRYLAYYDGQVRRLSSEGSPLPRIRLSKKQRRKLRKEYSEVRDLSSSELADKIMETPVVNPVQQEEEFLEEGDNA